MPVHLFQTFSSTSALLGLSRNCDYAACNSYLDALQHFRRAEGCQGQQLLWGMVAGTGLADQAAGMKASKTYFGGREVDSVTGGYFKEEAFKKVLAERSLGGVNADGSPVLPENFYRDPADGNFTVDVKEVFNADGTDLAQALKDLSVSLNTEDSDDSVLVFANLPAPVEQLHSGVSCSLERGGRAASKWSHDKQYPIESMMLPVMDEPKESHSTVNYALNYAMNDGLSVSDPMQICAIRCNSNVSSTTRSSDSASIKKGKWHEISGLTQITVTNMGERVIVVCTVKYTAEWGCQMSLGKFSVLRNGISIDPKNYGHQVVRAIQPGIKRTMVIAFVDDPEPGPHVYSVEVMVASGSSKVRELRLEPEGHFLSLIRVPYFTVCGPARVKSAMEIDCDRWTQVPGLEFGGTITNPEHRLLLTAHVAHTPTCLNYETCFTIVRMSAQGEKNLGSEDKGLVCISSASPAGSEYPVMMFMDSPGVGTFGYKVMVTSRNCDLILEESPCVNTKVRDSPNVEVGPYGQLVGVLMGKDVTPSYETGLVDPKSARKAYKAQLKEEKAVSMEKAFLDAISTAVDTEAK